MGVNTGTNRSRGGLFVQDNNTTTPEDTVFAYGVREIIVTTGTLTNNGQGTVTITTGGGGGGGSGTVTSVTLNAATTGLTISGGTSQTITTSGTFTLGGTLVPANGGTGMNTYNKGDLIVGGTTNPLETLGTGGRTAGDFLTIKAGLTELQWSSVLPPVNGGTGLTSYAKGDIIYADTGGVLFELAIGSAGDVLTVSASGIPEWAPASGGGSIGGSIADTQIAVGSGTDTISGSSELTFTAGGLPIGSLMDSITTNTTNATPASNSISNAAFTTSGSGTGAVIALTISGAAVTEATVTTAGKGYAVGDTLTFSTSVVGGTTDVVFTLSSTSPATGVEQVLQLAAPEATLKVQDTTSNAVITLDPSVPNNTGGVAMYWGTNTSPELYMKLGAFSGANNIDTKSRDFRIFGTTGNLMVMDENAQTSGFGNYYAFTTALPTYQLEGGVTNATTNTVISPVAARRGCTAVPAIGIGVGYDFVVQTTNTPSFALGSQIQSIWASGTGGSSENFDLYFNTMEAGNTPLTTRMIIRGETGEVVVGKAATIGGVKAGVGLTVESGSISMAESLVQTDPTDAGIGAVPEEFVSRICGSVFEDAEITDGEDLANVIYCGKTTTLTGGAAYVFGDSGILDGSMIGATLSFVSYGSAVSVTLDGVIFDACVVGGAVSATGFTVAEFEPFTIQIMGKAGGLGNAVIQVYGNAVPL